MSATKEYSNGEVTIVWEPGKCIHSAKCVNGLPTVFQPDKKPWIKVEGGTTEQIISQVKQCPSGALSYYLNAKGKDLVSESSDGVNIEVNTNGPLMVKGTINIIHKDGSVEVKSKSTALCRCGGSSNKPFCDGTHKKIGFEG